MSSVRAVRAAILALALAGGGSARAATHSWQVGDFGRLRVEGPFDVRVHVGQPSAVRAAGPQEAIDRLEVEQQGDLVVIHPNRSRGWGAWGWTDKNPLVIDVGARSLTAATLAGSGDLAVDRIKGDAIDLTVAGSGDLTAPAVEVGQARLTIAGSGNLTVMGHARAANASVTGSGDLHADKLLVDDAKVSLVGSGDLALAVRRAATVNLAGSGDVTIAGPASCTVTRSGSGDVRCAHQNASAAN